MLPQMMLFQQKQHESKRLFVSVHDTEEVARVVLREILLRQLRFAQPASYSLSAHIGTRGAAPSAAAPAG